MTFNEWRDSLPKCLSYDGGCDGDLMGYEHIESCPMYGKEFVTLEDAYNAGLEEGRGRPKGHTTWGTLA